jgi:hypothetical protein
MCRKSLKLEEPKFIDSKNPEKFLSETIESKKSRFGKSPVCLGGFWFGPSTSYIGILRDINLRS